MKDLRYEIGSLVRSGAGHKILFKANNDTVTLDDLKKIQKIARSFEEDFYKEILALLFTELSQEDKEFLKETFLTKKSLKYRTVDLKLGNPIMQDRSNSDHEDIAAINAIAKKVPSILPIIKLHAGSILVELLVFEGSTGIFSKILQATVTEALKDSFKGSPLERFLKNVFKFGEKQIDEKEVLRKSIVRNRLSQKFTQTHSDGSSTVYETTFESIEEKL